MTELAAAAMEIIDGSRPGPRSWPARSSSVASRSSPAEARSTEDDLGARTMFGRLRRIGSTAPLSTGTGCSTRRPSLATGGRRDPVAARPRHIRFETFADVCGKSGNRRGKFLAADALVCLTSAMSFGDSRGLQSKSAAMGGIDDGRELGI
jgi:hypothetical protein